ncbi:hypothetical protein BYI23_B010780 [Burkholderia sp. YI23]|nr:hypothetical protein BYI23_B010780 [Burkholderia sp. YI23]
MQKNSNQQGRIYRIGLLSATVALLTALSACGGGGGDSGNAAAVSNDSGNPASTPAGTTSSSTNASFFDSIFMTDSGSGFYQFGANAGSVVGTIAATGRTRFFVTSDADVNFTAVTSAVAGPYTQRYVTQAYITSEGAFTSDSTPYIDFGSNSKIFQKLPQGYELGMQGMSAPLYRVTIQAEDVSGLPVSEAIRKDEGPATNGLSRLLSQDSSVMPPGSQIYQIPYTVLTTHLWANLSSGTTGFSTLEQVQSRAGGEIQSLGGYRYLKPAPNSATYVEYNGGIYYGELLNAGDLHDVVPAAYNSKAADYLAQREAAALTQ